MNTKEIKKWWDENKDDIMFGACIAGLTYSCVRLGYILGRRDGYITGVCDMWDVIAKNSVKLENF